MCVIDPPIDDINFLPKMLENALNGADVVFANNNQKSFNSLGYRASHAMFQLLYSWFNGIHLATEAPQYRILNKRVINFILQHPQPVTTYRHLPAIGGFSKINLTYSKKPITFQRKNLGKSIDRGMKLLISTTRAPMRLVTSLSLFGAFANLIYTVYVLVVAIVKVDVAAGWVSLSLQQSGESPRLH